MEDNLKEVAIDMVAAARNTPKTEDSNDDQAIQTEDNSEGSTEA